MNPLAALLVTRIADCPSTPIMRFADVPVAANRLANGSRITPAHVIVVIVTQGMKNITADTVASISSSVCDLIKFHEAA